MFDIPPQPEPPSIFVLIIALLMIGFTLTALVILWGLLLNAT